MTLRPTILHRHVASFNETRVAQALLEGPEEFGESTRRTTAEEADDRQGAFLRPYCQWPHGDDAEHDAEDPPGHAFCRPPPQQRTTRSHHSSPTCITDPRALLWYHNA